ncbi:MAG: metallophosphoesterase [Chitinispirillia bacterium]|nr:metallophosphoesterase [Chitinispirillia bacterium]MCL2269317.1 metallophosphoesterase [Chitinispirillia bacterium]
MSGIAFIFIFVISFYGGTNIYIAKRLYHGVNWYFSGVNKVLFVCLYAFFALTLLLGFLPLPWGIDRTMRVIGSYWIGIYMYMGLLFIVADLLIFLGRAAHIIHRTTLNGIRFYSALTVVLLTAAIIFYGVHNADNIKHVSYEVDFNEPAVSGMKIVLISDLHLGAVKSEERLESIVQAINDLKPGIVCMAGDIFNDDINAVRDPDRVTALFKSIEAEYGVYACLGNHDGGRTTGKIMDLLEKSNITLLNDDYRIIDGRLALFGRLDSRPIGGFGELSRRDITETIDSVGANMPVIVMDHNPSKIADYSSKVNMILSGHTHRGQIFPGSLVTRVMYTVDYGHYQKDADSPHVIVTSGVSTWGPPMRIGTNNEIVSIVLR